MNAPPPLTIDQGAERAPTLPVKSAVELVSFVILILGYAACPTLTFPKFIDAGATEILMTGAAPPQITATPVLYRNHYVLPHRGCLRTRPCCKYSSHPIVSENVVYLVFLDKESVAYTASLEMSSQDSLIGKLFFSGIFSCGVYPSKRGALYEGDL